MKFLPYPLSKTPTGMGGDGFKKESGSRLQSRHKIPGRET